MKEHVYKKIEITGTSEVSSDDAIQNAIAKVSESVNHMDWFEVTEIRGMIDNNKVHYWQVTVKIGFQVTN